MVSRLAYAVHQRIHWLILRQATVCVVALPPLVAGILLNACTRASAVRPLLARILANACFKFSRCIHSRQVSLRMPAPELLRCVHAFAGSLATTSLRVSAVRPFISDNLAIIIIERSRLIRSPVHLRFCCDPRVVAEPMMPNTFARCIVFMRSDLRRTAVQRCEAPISEGFSVVSAEADALDAPPGIGIVSVAPTNRSVRGLTSCSPETQSRQGTVPLVALRH